MGLGSSKNIDFELRVTVLNLTKDKFLEVEDGLYGNQRRMNLWSQFHLAEELSFTAQKVAEAVVSENIVGTPPR